MDDLEINKKLAKATGFAPSEIEVSDGDVMVFSLDWEIFDYKDDFVSLGNIVWLIDNDHSPYVEDEGHGYPKYCIEADFEGLFFSLPAFT